MKYSFVGMSKPMKDINNLLRRGISNFRRQHPGEALPLEPSGIFAPNLSQAAAFAGDNDMGIHYSFFDVLKKSDVIFVFLGEKSLESLPLSFNKYDIKGKIFCHASPAFTSDILNVNSYNTYTSLLITACPERESQNAGYGPLLLEGYGRRFDEFRECLDFMGVDHSVITSEEKRLYLTAMNFISDFPDIIAEIGKKLMKISLADAPEAYDKILQLMSDKSAGLTSYNALENGDTNYLNHQNDLMNRMGLEPINSLFKSIVNLKEQR